MKRPAGFTLIEVVVVLAIFAVLSIMAYGGLRTVLTLREKVVESLDRTTAIQKSFLRLRNDFQQLRARPARDGFGQTQPALLVAEDAVEFTRGGWRNPTSLPRSALERVAYRLNEDKQLIRQSWRVLDRAQDSRLAEVAVIDQVEAARWRFLDEKLQWHDRWPDESAGTTVVPEALPRAVELTLELTDLGEVRFLFSSTNASPKPPPPPAPPT
jgi:general secretion pathway protein J